MIYTDELKELLLSNENIKFIWFETNSDEWHTHEVEGTKQISREEILKPKKKDGVK
jgi:hypothetical protein